MKMHPLQRNFSQPTPYSGCILKSWIALTPGNRMNVEMRTKRRWIVSVLEAVAETPETRASFSAPLRRTTGRSQMTPGQKGFAMRLKAATRPLADAAR